MTVAIIDVLEMKERLSSEFWSGNRWLTFDNSKRCTTIRDIRCFPDLRAARAYCQYKASIGQLYFIKALGSILKVLNCGFGWKNRIAATKLLELLNCYPITSFRQGDDLVSSLITGEYYPVIWKKVVFPLSVIGRYHIIEWPHAGRKLHKRIEQPAYSFDNVTDALKVFDKQTRFNNNEKKCSSPVLLLVGRFQDQLLEFNADGSPEESTGLLIYTAHIIHDPTLQSNVYKINMVHDLSMPVIVKQGVIVRYDIIKGKLDFFDCCLRKIRPGAVIDYRDLAFFAYQQPIKVVNM